MIEDILATLRKVRKTGASNWIACCPAHEDKSPSLTLKQADDGRVLAMCHGGCKFDEIVVAVGLGWKPWFPEEVAPSSPLPSRPFPAGDVLEALAFEVLVVSIIAGDIHSKREIKDEDMERLFLAKKRIDEAKEIALGRR
jgi:hypothetical protein